MEKITFSVNITAEDIANGERRSCVACPLALAFNRCVPAELSARLFEFWGCGRRCSAGGVIGVFLDGRFCLLWIPARVRQFVVDFDAGMPVSPLSFELSI